MCSLSASVHAVTTSRLACVGLRTAWSIMRASSGTVGSSTGRPVCSDGARLGPRRAAFRHRRAHPRVVAPHLLPRRHLACGHDLSRELPGVVPAEDLHRGRGYGVLLLRLRARARARALARGAPVPYVGVFNHALPPRRRRESDPRAAVGAGGVLHGRGRPGDERRDRGDRRGGPAARGDPVGPGAPAPARRAGPPPPRAHQPPPPWLYPLPRPPP